jgi:hypothetical protein
MKVKKAVKKLTRALTKKKDFHDGYKANIAVAFQDACSKWRAENPRRKSTLPVALVHELSNQAAENFLTLWCAEGAVDFNTFIPVKKKNWKNKKITK